MEYLIYIFVFLIIIFSFFMIKISYDKFKSNKTRNEVLSLKKSLELAKDQVDDLEDSKIKNNLIIKINNQEIIINHILSQKNIKNVDFFNVYDSVLSLIEEIKNIKNN
ncbi:hypothetical protein VAMP_12n167 [Candidatus Vampirococcus lugosii]|uniref:Uncharacterized protein n=2 Tax=Candidatus Vampirococcus lugosii TaxID=2789015 RepID=A0ABS5QK54_9BACT|nr:hypothetical protein [Candidatus Vampirococcus lugosii]